MIRAELSYTKAHFRKLLSLNKKNTFRKIYCAACFALGLIFMFLFIRIDSSEIAYLTLGLILLICGGITLRWTVMMLPANQLKKFQQLYPDGTWRFIFNEDKILCDSKSVIHSRRSEYAYAAVDSACFKDDFFMFKLCGNSAVAMFFSDDIKEGSPDQLRELMRQKLGDKFTVIEQ